MLLLGRCLPAVEHRRRACVCVYLFSWLCLAWRSVITEARKQRGIPPIFLTARAALTMPAPRNLFQICRHAQGVGRDFIPPAGKCWDCRPTDIENCTYFARMWKICIAKFVSIPRESIICRLCWEGEGNSCLVVAYLHSISSLDWEDVGLYEDISQIK